MFKLLLPFILFLLPLHAFLNPPEMKERIVKNKEVELWTETFGDPNHPAVLLIMGAGVSGIYWPDLFCERLSEAGYFVIRYDHRDIGKSSLINYQEHPYTLEDMAQDSLAILDSYKISKAHIVGLSMGGFIAQILAIKHPHRLQSMISMMSSPDHSVMLAAIAGQNTDSYSLPPPPLEMRKTWMDMKQIPIESVEDRIALNLKNWKLCSGAQGYNDQEFSDREKRNIARTKSFVAPFNHWPAMASWPDRLNDLQKVKVPTLVIHGGKDVVLPVEHGIATAKAIPGSTLVVVSEMGHCLSNFYVNQIAPLVILHLKKHAE